MSMTAIVCGADIAGATGVVNPAFAAATEAVIIDNMHGVRMLSAWVDG